MTVILPCPHQPQCPSADSPDREAAHTVAAHPEQGWSLLCNGVLLFEDTGELLPDGRIIAPHRPTPTPDDDLFVRYMRAFEASTEHQAGCGNCQDDRPCAAGVWLHERFTSLQDHYRASRRRGLITV
ncbi:hypothetical protein GCM10027168_44450 [Streptomyces capparidis]